MMGEQGATGGSNSINTTNKVSNKFFFVIMDDRGQVQGPEPVAAGGGTGVFTLLRRRHTTQVQKCVLTHALTCMHSQVYTYTHAHKHTLSLSSSLSVSHGCKHACTQARTHTHTKMRACARARTHAIITCRHQSRLHV